MPASSSSTNGLKIEGAVPTYLGIMSGLAFLQKKSFHTKNLNNVEKVWIQQQKKEDEEKKLIELRKQLEEERELEQLQLLQASTGQVVLGATQKEKLSWMYQGPSGPSNDDLMLGNATKPELVIDQQQSLKELESKSKPGALYTKEESNEASESFSRLNQDPLFAIKRREAEQRKRVLDNPFKVEAAKKLVEKSSKKNRKKKRGSSSDSDKKHSKKHKRHRKHTISRRDRSSERSVQKLNSRSDRSQHETRSCSPRERKIRSSSIDNSKHERRRDDSRRQRRSSSIDDNKHERRRDDSRRQRRRRSPSIDDDKHERRRDANRCRRRSSSIDDNKHERRRDDSRRQRRSPSIDDNKHERRRDDSRRQRRRRSPSIDDDKHERRRDASRCQRRRRSPSIDDNKHERRRDETTDLVHHYDPLKPGDSKSIKPTIQPVLSLGPTADMRKLRQHFLLEQKEKLEKQQMKLSLKHAVVERVAVNEDERLQKLESMKQDGAVHEEQQIRDLEIGKRKKLEELNSEHQSSEMFEKSKFLQAKEFQASNLEERLQSKRFTNQKNLE